eukprot:UN02385
MRIIMKYSILLLLFCTATFAADCTNTDGMEAVSGGACDCGSEDTLKVSCADGEYCVAVAHECLSQQNSEAFKTNMGCDTNSAEWWDYR